MTASSYPLHTILDEVWQPLIEASEKERALVERHVGRYIVTWSLVDLFLGMTVAAWQKRPQADVLRLQTADKIKELRRCLPAGWRDGQRLLDHLGSGRIYRNALAHLMLGMSGVHDGQTVKWNLWDPHRGSLIELTPETIDLRERDAKITSCAVSVLMGERYVAQEEQTLARNFLAADIKAQPGTWPTRDDYNKYAARVIELFPGN